MREIVSEITDRTHRTGIPFNIPQSESKIKEYAVSCELRVERTNERTQLYRYIGTEAHTEMCTYSICVYVHEQLGPVISGM